MNWKEEAIKALERSLYPVPIELNELDWKGGLSPKTERLAQHISAFGGQQGGGVFVYGVKNDATLHSISKHDADLIVQKLGNIALNNMANPIKIEHAVMDFKGHSLLFVHIPEQIEKPVRLRGNDLLNCYCRSAGQTVKMSENQIKLAMSTSQRIPFEKRIAKGNLSNKDVLELLNYRKLFELLDKNVPASSETVINNLKEHNLCTFEKDKWQITNLGAILFANDLSNFEDLQGKSVIVRKYISTNNRNMEFEKVMQQGYAAEFENLVDFVMSHTQKGEIRDVLRKTEYTYPRIAIRECVANALIHQDFSIMGMPITIEIFSNRLAITNPGAPLNDINRLIDLPPHSRNEILANTMLLLHICEKRGSGIDYAIEAIEKEGLPAVEFTRGEEHTRVFLFPKKRLTEMTRDEKIMACYQHACLMYEDKKPINNQSVRERFGIEKNNSSIASRIIADTVERGFIKVLEDNGSSKKYAVYYPYYG